MEDKRALLLMVSKQLWMYQLLFFTISLRYFVDFKFLIGNFTVVPIRDFFLIENPNI